MILNEKIKRAKDKIRSIALFQLNINFLINLSWRIRPSSDQINMHSKIKTKEIFNFNSRIRF